jgi:carbon storage regulator
MLVFSRQKGESIMIGNLVEVTVVEIRGQQVRIGVSAPTEVPVHRREVFEKIQAAEPTKTAWAVSDDDDD